MADFNPALSLPIKWSIGEDRFNDDDDAKVLTLTIPVASLDQFIDHLKALQPATELGISHTQTFDYLPLEDGKTLTVLITTLYFKNEKLESKLPLRELSGNNVYHDLGIAITYSRRYALAAAYGIGSEHDDDAVALTQPPAKEKGTDRTHTKAKQTLEPVSEQDK